MKKIIGLTLALMLALSLAACGGSNNGGSSTTPPTDNNTSSTSQETGNNTSDTSQEADNNTENVVDSPASESGGEAVDILALVGKTIDNERLVLVSNDKEDPLYGEANHYLFLTFDDDGKIDQFGESGSYYTFADQAAFDKGLEKMSSNKGSNRTSLFIQGWTTYPNDWPDLTFVEIVERIETDSGQDNYSAYYDIVR